MSWQRLFIFQVINCYYNLKALVTSGTSFIFDSLKLHFCSSHVTIYKTASVMERMLGQSYSYT